MTGLKFKMDYDEYITTSYKIYIRDGGKCVLSGENRKSKLESYPHHCFFKSEYYGKDRDGMWNRVTIAHVKHEIITNGWGKERKELDEKCKLIALKRYRGKNREKLEAIMRAKGYFLPDGQDQKIK